MLEDIIAISKFLILLLLYRCIVEYEIDITVRESGGGPGLLGTVCFKVDPRTGNSGKIVEGYELLFPGDSSYPLINRGIQCRCWKDLGRELNSALGDLD